MAAKRFAQIAGIIALLLGILGFFITDLAGFLQFDPLHNLLHVILGLWGIVAGFGDSLSAPRAYAKFVGIFYIIVFVVGLVSPDFLTMHFEWSENIYHIVIALWGLYAGFRPVAAPAPVAPVM